MFEEDHQAAPKKRFSTVAVLAAGGAVVATVIASLASVLAPGGHAPDAGPPEPRADARLTSVSRVPNARIATVVVTVSTEVAAGQRREGGSQPEGQPASAERPSESTAGTSSEPRSTTQPPSNPPTSYEPTTPSSSSASPSSTTTTTETTGDL